MGSETYVKFLSSSHTLGFLLVVAVSGSLAFLTFGKFRLKPSASDQDTSNKIEDEMQENGQQIDDSNTVPKQSSLVSRSGKRSMVMKKVRFALDVVEPSGNGHEYRRGSKLSHKTSNKGYTEKQEQETVCEDGSNKYKASRSKTQIFSKQSLPANRMLLYSGMQRYKALTALHIASTQ